MESTGTQLKLFRFNLDNFGETPSMPDVASLIDKYKKSAFPNHMILTPPISIGPIEIISVDQENNSANLVFHICSTIEDMQNEKVRASVSRGIEAVTNYLKNEWLLKDGVKYRISAVLHPPQFKQ